MRVFQKDLLSAMRECKTIIQRRRKKMDKLEDLQKQKADILKSGKSNAHTQTHTHTYIYKYIQSMIYAREQIHVCWC